MVASFDLINSNGNHKVVDLKGNVRIDYGEQTASVTFGGKNRNNYVSIYAYNNQVSYIDEEQTEYNDKNVMYSMTMLENESYSALLDIVGSDLVLSQDDLLPEKLDKIMKKYDGIIKNIDKSKLSDGEVKINFANGKSIIIDFETYDEEVNSDLISGKKPDGVMLTVINGKKSDNFFVRTNERSLVDAVVSVKKGDRISSQDKQKLLQVMSSSGKSNVLENCDLNPQQKLNLAKNLGYNEYYDIKLSDDGKTFIIEVKETPMLYPDPKAFSMEREFGTDINVLYNNNKELFKLRTGNKKLDAHNEGESYEHTKFRAGDVIKLPVENVSFLSGPSGFWTRLISVS